MGWTVNSPESVPLEHDSHSGGLARIHHRLLQVDISTSWFVCGPQCWVQAKLPFNAVAALLPDNVASIWTKMAPRRLK